MRKILDSFATIEMINYKNLNDTELFLLIKEGDKFAFEEVYHRFYGLLFIHAFKKLGNQETVQDLLQDLFISLWNNRSNLQIQGAVNVYLYTAVRYKVINIISRKTNEEKYLASLQDFIAVEQVQTDYLIRERQLSAIVEQEINALPPAMRRIFVMSRFEHRSHKEIAELLELSELTVKTQVKNALRILRKRLGLVRFILLFIEF